MSLLRRLEQIRDKDAGVDKKPLTLRADTIDERSDPATKVVDPAHLFVSPDGVEGRGDGVDGQEETPRASAFSKTGDAGASPATPLPERSPTAGSGGG